MSPLATWGLVGAMLGLIYLFIFALCRAAARADRQMDAIMRRNYPRVYELDSGKLALAMHRAQVIELRGVRGSEEGDRDVPGRPNAAEGATQPRDKGRA